MNCLGQTQDGRTNRLRSATLTIGYCDLVLSLYLGPVVKVAGKLRLTSDVTLEDLLQDMSAVSYWFLVCAALDILLLYGTHRSRENYMLPYITVNGLGILGIVILTMQLFMEQATRNSGNSLRVLEDIFFALSSLLSLGALFFTWLVCVNHFRQLHGKDLADEVKSVDT